MATLLQFYVSKTCKLKKKKVMLDNFSKPSLLIFVTQTKPKQSPPSTLLPFPFPPTWKEKQQPARAVKPPIFSQPQPPGASRAACSPLTSLQNHPRSLQVTHFYGAPQGAAGCCCQDPPSIAPAFPPVRRRPLGERSSFQLAPHLPRQGGVSAAVTLQCHMMSKTLFF